MSAARIVSGETRALLTPLGRRVDQHEEAARRRKEHGVPDFAQTGSVKTNRAVSATGKPRRLAALRGTGARDLVELSSRAIARDLLAGL